MSGITREYVDGVLAKLMADGYIELVGVLADGDLSYRLTDKGEAYVEQMGERP